MSRQHSVGERGCLQFLLHQVAAAGDGGRRRDHVPRRLRQADHRLKAAAHGRSILADHPEAEADRRQGGLLGGDQDADLLPDADRCQVAAVGLLGQEDDFLVVCLPLGRGVHDLVEEEVLSRFGLELEVGEEVMAAVRHGIVEQRAGRHCEVRHRPPTGSKGYRSVRRCGRASRRRDACGSHAHGTPARQAATEYCTLRVFTASREERGPNAPEACARTGEPRRIEPRARRSRGDQRYRADGEGRPGRKAKGRADLPPCRS